MNGTEEAITQAWKRTSRPLLALLNLAVVLVLASLACATHPRTSPPPAQPGLTENADSLTRVTRSREPESQPRLAQRGGTLLISVRDPSVPESAGFYAQFRSEALGLVTGHRRLIANPGADATFFSDDVRILYADLGAPNAFFAIYDRGTGEHTRLFDELPGKDVQQPSIHPGEEKIAYHAFFDGVEMLCTINLDGTGFEKHGPGLSPVWHPAEPLLAFDMKVDGVFQTFTLNVETGERTQLTAGRHKHEFPVWSPDGRWLCVVSSREGDSNLYALSPDGSDVIPLTTGPSRKTHPHWAADGNIYFTSDAGSPQWQEKPFPWRWTFGDIWRFTPRLPR